MSLFYCASDGIVYLKKVSAYSDFVIFHGAVVVDICAKVGFSDCGGHKWSERGMSAGKELDDRVK